MSLANKKCVKELDRAVLPYLSLVYFVTKVEYKKDLENNRGYSMNYCDTPQFKNVSKISKFTSDVSFQYLMCGLLNLVAAGITNHLCVCVCVFQISMFWEFDYD